MHAEELRAALGEIPFRPFRLHFSSGRVVEIVSPDLVVVSGTGRTAFAYRYASDAFDIIDLGLVESIEYPDGSKRQASKRRRRSA